MKQLILITSMVLLLAACNTANNPPANQAAPNPSQQPKETQRVQQTAPTPQYNQSSQATAQRLVQLASRVKNVNSATAVVLGKYAVVGIDVKATLDRPEVGVIKYSVAEALKEDPQGATAIVTADPDIVQRLREMSTQMKQGRPVAGIMNELADIVGRIIPQLPQDVKRREQPNTQQNQQRMNNQTNTKPEGNNKIPLQK